MNPMQLMMMRSMGGGTPSAPGATGAYSPEQLAAMLGAVQSPAAPEAPPLPYANAPNAPRALNPQMSMQMLQAMAQLNNPQRMPSLGALLGGKV